MRTRMLAVGSVVWLLACSDGTLTPIRNAGPARPLSPSFTTAAPGCTAVPTVVATSETQLIDALGNAAPGAVIGIDGLIPVTADLFVTTPNLTLTCVTPGSGIFAQAGGTVFTLLAVFADGFTVDGLVLDGTNSSDLFYAEAVADVHFTRNSVRCSPALNGGGCAFFHATPNAVVSGNEFRSNGSFTGVHLQAGIDGARIEDNTISTTSAGWDVPTFGGLRVRDGANVVIARNTVQGPWQNSAAFVDLDASIIQENSFDGAVVYGIRAPSGISFRPVSMTNNVIRDNRISGAGRAGIFLNSACNNRLLGNTLEGNAGDVGVLFDVQTGSNLFAGDKHFVVDNGGALDCDGDGSGDPNRITGLGVTRREEHGTPPPAATSTGRLH